MKRVSDYWRIPEDYVRDIGGVKWSIGGETLDHVHDGSTLAFGKEIVLFLEGFSLQRPLIHFGCVVLLLDAVLKERPAGTTDWMRLGAAFRKTRKMHRNAGAFCAVLCEGVPVVPDPPTAQEMWQEVASRVSHAGTDNQLRAQIPPLAPAEFRAIVGRALARYGDDEVEHWLRHGTGPLKTAGDDVARALLATKPPSLDGVLADLAQRPRLAGAVPFVAQITGALSLPPRRLDQHELPQGGYADVTTRGRPEYILPSQYALDDLEFLRRFAENELLYYRREEPQAPAREELIVLLDQGVRTWGPVRLLLAATLFALGKASAGRKLTFRVAATSSGGVPCDPLTENKDVLAQMLEASDLTAAPGLALERVLEQPATGPRDVVLLTQPRNLAEPAVASAARRAQPPTRLFAVGADAHGEVEFSEIRQGVPIRLSRCRVDLTPKAPPPRPAPARRHESIGMWTGDVEPVPYPFRFGTDTRRQQFHYDFDESGDWLLNASADGMLHALRMDGSRIEMLPRGMIEGNVLSRVHAVRGVAGGCVVGGVVAGKLVAAHYDFNRRTCTMRALADTDRTDPWAWHYFPEFHAVIATNGAEVHQLCYGLGLSPSVANSPSLPPDLASRMATQAFIMSDDSVRPNTFFVWTGDEIINNLPGNWVNLSSNSGTVSMGGPAIAMFRFTPVADGQPLLRGLKLDGRAIVERSTLAFYASASERFDPSPRLLLFRLPEGVPVGDYRQPRQYRGFALSRDERSLLA